MIPTSERQRWVRTNCGRLVDSTRMRRQAAARYGVSIETIESDIELANQITTDWHAIMDEEIAAHGTAEGIYRMMCRCYGEGKRP